jgi:hypothetical protein
MEANFLGQVYRESASQGWGLDWWYKTMYCTHQTSARSVLLAVWCCQTSSHEWWYKTVCLINIRHRAQCSATTWLCQTAKSNQSDCSLYSQVSCSVGETSLCCHSWQDRISGDDQRQRIRKIRHLLLFKPWVVAYCSVDNSDFITFKANLYIQGWTMTTVSDLGLCESPRDWWESRTANSHGSKDPLFWHLFYFWLINITANPFVKVRVVAGKIRTLWAGFAGLRTGRRPSVDLQAILGETVWG